MRWAIRESAATGAARSDDRVGVWEHADALVVAVSDGAGGMGGGGRAATLVIEAARAVRPTRRSESLCGLLRALDAVVHADRAAGEATAALAIVSEARVVGASVGNSAIWLFGGERYVELTGGADRRRVGSGRVAPRGFAHAAETPFRILAATDGLFEYVAMNAIIESAAHGDLEDATDRLVGLARLHPGALPDDVGIVLVEVCSRADGSPGSTDRGAGSGGGARGGARAV